MRCPDRRKSRPEYPASLIVLSSALALAASAQAGRFAVQVEASPSRAEAEASVERLAAQGIDAYLVESLVPGKGRFYRVRVGDLPAREEAERLGQQLKARGAVRDFFVAEYQAPVPEAASAVDQPEATSLEPPGLPAPVPSPESAPDPYARFQDADVGFSFEYPSSWVGRPLSASEKLAQRVTAGAMFKSDRGVAFLNATWNHLDHANSPDHDNESVVDLILESMASGKGTEYLNALSRRVFQDGPWIKTFVDLEAGFRAPNQPAPLEFLGKGVIIRASKGILLLVVFYAKDAPESVALDADHIVKTAVAPD
jgi:hypothetical protein